MRTKALKESQKRYRQTAKGKLAQQLAWWRWYHKKRLATEYQRKFTTIVKQQGKLVENLHNAAIYCWRGDHYIEFTDIPNKMRHYEECMCIRN